MSDSNQENPISTEEQCENSQTSTKIVDDDVIDEASLKSEDGNCAVSDESSSISSVSPQKVVYQLVPIEYQGRSGNGITIQERTSFLVQELGLHQCAPSMASARINDYIATMISGSSWKAVHSRDIPIIDQENEDEQTFLSVDYMIQVTGLRSIETSLGHSLIASCEYVKLLSHDNGDDLDRDLKQEVDAYLIRNADKIEFLSLQPIIVIDEKDNFETVEIPILEQISELQSHLQFWEAHIFRVYDLTNMEDKTFKDILQCRINIFLNMTQDNLPFGVKTRYMNMLENYRIYVEHIEEAREWLRQLHLEGEANGYSEIVHAKTQELLAEISVWEQDRNRLAEMLSIWEALDLSCTGPRTPKCTRVTNGKRDSKRIVFHFVGKNITAKTFAKIPEDELENVQIKTYSSLAEAIENLHQGDRIYICNSIWNTSDYHFLGLHDINESDVCIIGLGEQIVVDGPSGSYSDLFINIRANNVSFENLIFVQNGNAEGIARVELGSAHFRNCVFNCYSSGITVASQASLTMESCEVRDCKGPAIVKNIGSSLKLVKVKTINCEQAIQVERMQQGEVVISNCSFGTPDRENDVIVKQVEAGSTKEVITGRLKVDDVEEEKETEDKVDDGAGGEKVPEINDKTGLASEEISGLKADLEKFNISVHNTNLNYLIS